MPDFTIPPMDLIRELRLRQWARQHFVPENARRETWHPVVLDEMRRRDEELLNDCAISAQAVESVPEPIHHSEPMEHDLQFNIFHHDWMGDPISNPGSAYVPLAPSADWEFDSASHEIPAPHVSARTREVLVFPEISHLAATA